MTAIAPRTRRVSTTTRHLSPDERAQLVALTAQTAIATGAPMIAAVAVRLGVAPQTAKRAIAVARRDGWCIPYKHPAHVDRSAPPSLPATSLHGVLRCACGWTVPLDDAWQPVMTLARHTRQVHGRRPTLAERTPVRREVAA